MVTEKSFHSLYIFWVVKRKLTQPHYYKAETGGFEHYIQDATQFHEEKVAVAVAETLENCVVIPFRVEYHNYEG